MLDAAKAVQAIQSGLAAICAWCEHYWDATDNKPEGHSGCVMYECGGPIVHKSFPLYKGPWNPKVKYCFICGKNADAMAAVHHQGALGVCADHIQKFKDILEANGKRVNVKEREVVTLQ
jgi:hypothetical protein